jgi:hypothetical protein
MSGMIHKASLTGDREKPFGGIECIYQLDIWESDDNELVVRLSKDGNLPFAEQRFRDCETQHSDSERWLNDKVGYPNPFAGVLLQRAWE